MNRSVRVIWLGILGATMIQLFFFQMRVVNAPLVPHLFGHKSDSTFDLWVIGHFMMGIGLYGLAMRLSPKHALELMLTGIILWERVELPAELGDFGPAIAFWKDGVEHWSNRFIADPATCVLGALVCRRFPKIFWPTFVVSIFWELIQLSAPTCMTLQEQLLH